MPSLSIDHPQHRNPTSPLPPPHGPPHHHRLNRYRRPHHLRISSPPKSPLIFSSSSSSYHPHHSNQHPLSDPRQQLLTPEIVFSQQNQSSPWKGIPTSTSTTTTPAIIPPSTTPGIGFTISSLQRADSILSNNNPKFSSCDNNNHFGHTSTASIVSGGSGCSSAVGAIPFTYSQQNLLQRLHQEKLLLQQQQAASHNHHHHRQSLQSSNKKLQQFSLSSRNDEALLSSTQFYPEEISLMKMDEDFAIFNTEIDFTQPDPSRPLQIRVSGRSIYVDPQFAQDLSPIFTNFLARELVAGKRRCVEMQREDISFGEVLEMAKVLCPYELGMFPKPVEPATFCSLSRLSSKFKVPKLKLACELFITRMSLEDPYISIESLCEFFVSSYRDGLSQATKVRLLEALISRGITAVDRRTCDIPVLTELIREAAIKYRANELMHSDLLNDAKLRVPCATCRLEQPNVPLPAIKGELSNTGIPAFVVCSRCRSTICCGCVLKPCKKAIDEFVKMFSERYNSN